MVEYCPPPLLWFLCVYPSFFRFVIFISFSERANIVDLAVDELLSTGVTVTCVTCDSPSVQLSMMKELGADLNPDSPDLEICKEKAGPPIYFIHDNCHALKLVRNGWHHHRRIKNSKNEVIDWAYVERLFELQSLEHLKCANKLSTHHIFFQNVKMKVKYAAQVLSRSVALSLKFCREELNLPQFKGSEATEEFLLIINDIFDLLNSRSKYSSSFYSMKNAMSDENKDVWMPVFDKTKEYLLGLSSMNGKSMVKEDSRKTGFAGFLLNIEAFKLIYAQLVVNGPLQYLCTYKFSQDPLEHFFVLYVHDLGPIITQPHISSNVCTEKFCLVLRIKL